MDNIPTPNFHMPEDEEFESLPRKQRSGKPFCPFIDGACQPSCQMYLVLETGDRCSLALFGEFVGKRLTEIPKGSIDSIVHNLRNFMQSRFGGR